MNHKIVMHEPIAEYLANVRPWCLRLVFSLMKPMNDAISIIDQQIMMTQIATVSQVGMIYSFVLFAGLRSFFF